MKTTILIIASFLFAGWIKAQSSVDGLTSKFNAGYYYTWQGDKKPGELKMLCQPKFGTLPHNSFYFKGSDGKQDRKTTADAMTFVIGTDSFIVIRNIKHGDYELPEDYAHVDAVDGDITTVTHYTSTGAGIDFKLEGLTLYIKKGFTYTSLKAAQKAK